MEFQDFLMDLLYTTHSIQSRTYFCACRHFQGNWRRWEWNSTPKSNCRAEQQTAKLATREGLRLFDSLGSVLAIDWACLHLVKFVSQPFLWFTDKLSLSNGQSTQHPGCLCNCIMEKSKYICGFVQNFMLTIHWPLYYLNCRRKNFPIAISLLSGMLCTLQSAVA